MNEENKLLPIKKLKALSRGQLIGKYNFAILITLTITFLMYLVTAIEVSVIGDNTSGYITGLVIDFIVSLLFGIFSYGQRVFFLKIARGSNQLSFFDIFSGFKTVSDKAIIIQAVFTGISFLGLIPQILMHFGIIVVPDDYYLYFAYGVIILQNLLSFLTGLYLGMSFYILADHNEYSAKEVIEESLKLMKNKKGRLFLIYLSTLPLCLVSICACGIGVLWFNVFLETLIANFYLNAIGEESFNVDTFNQNPPTEPPQDGWSTLDTH